MKLMKKKEASSFEDEAIISKQVLFLDSYSNCNLKESYLLVMEIAALFVST